MTATHQHSAANAWRDLWSIRPGVTYLNHGSFGPTSRAVSAARNEWSARLESEPMDFYVRQLEGHLDAARSRVADVFGTRGDRLLFVDNATYGMNIVANSFPLSAGDEVLATNQEYGAVLRIWRERCKAVGAQLVVPKLPETFRDRDEVVAAVMGGVTDRTRLIVISHITSPTALILPVAEICARARERGVRVCIDGPHALAAVPVRLDDLGCDFYCASGHKWLTAPLGSGFLYVHSRWQQVVRPLVVSWGNSLSGRPHSWQDEFVWSGTRDAAAVLSTPAAIDFFANLPEMPLLTNAASHSPTSMATTATSNAEPRRSPARVDEGDWSKTTTGREPGIHRFRTHSHCLVAAARSAVAAVTETEPIGTPEWYGTMASLPLPDWVSETPHGHMHPIQAALWEQYRIEIPVTSWNGRRHLRVSCHLYNTLAEIEYLADALRAILRARIGA
ncbi:MAG: aminotransferase class V-fold PLP-dependent enzyme [Planctomycetes bacterium]|nr:aminotransferase class V-fold PLP-dependent enzyme [Planctomycetota bacterium]